MKLNIYSIFIFISIASCYPSKKTKNFEQKAAIILNRAIDTSYYVILFIPIQACPYCIKPTIDFAKKNRNNQKIIYIFSDYRKKSIQIKTGTAIFKNKNFFIDAAGLAFKYNLINNTPVAYFKNDEGGYDSLEINSINKNRMFDKIIDFVQE